MELSIIVPHKNEVPGLVRLVSSIKFDGEFEIIVVDDHSNQDALEAVTSFCVGKNRIKLCENPIDRKGAGAARNTGLSQATGRWILFADADDFYLPSFNQIVNKYIKSRADIVYFRPSYGENTGRHIAYEYIYQNSQEYPQLLLWFSYPWSKLIRKKFISENKIMFDEISKNNDINFSVRALVAANTVEISMDSIYFYEIHDRGITANYSNDSIISSLMAHALQYRLVTTHWSKSTLMQAYPLVFYQPYMHIIQNLEKAKTARVVLEGLRIYSDVAGWTPTLPKFIDAIKGYVRKKALYAEAHALDSPVSGKLAASNLGGESDVNTE
jgi:glycosyltransferase involved in cell wall biosynthesis